MWQHQVTRNPHTCFTHVRERSYITVPAFKASVWTSVNQHNTRQAIHCFYNSPFLYIRPIKSTNQQQSPDSERSERTQIILVDQKPNKTLLIKMKFIVLVCFIQIVTNTSFPLIWRLKFEFYFVIFCVIIENHKSLFVLSLDVKYESSGKIIIKLNLFTDQPDLWLMCA